MDIHAERKWIISEIAKVKDPELLTAFKSLLKYRAKHQHADWWDELPVAVQESVKRGEKQAENEELKPHSEVFKKYEKWL